MVLVYSGGWVLGTVWLNLQSYNIKLLDVVLVSSSGC